MEMNENIKPEEQEEEIEQPSLRETLEAAFKGATEQDDEGKESSMVRDEKGRFRPRETAEPIEAAPVAVEAPVAETPTEAAPVDIAPPASWSNEVKAQWATLPPDVRKYIAEREDGVHKALTRHDEERNFGRVMSQTVGPYAQTLRDVNLTPEKAVGALLNVDQVLRFGNAEQKLQMVHDIMRTYQVPLDAVVQHQPVQPDPRLNALQQELQAIRQEVQQAHLTREQQDLQKEFESFKANAPHLEAVRTVMSDLLDRGLAQGFQDAYEQAVWLNPETRKLMLAQQVESELATKQQTQRVARAKAAGSSVAGSPGGVTPVPPSANRSLREELAEQMRAAKSRV